jgi:hypothetical protein
MARIDGARRGRAHVALPDRPVALWRTTVGGSLDLASIAVDERGAVLVAGINRKLTQLGPEGNVEWRASTGEGPSVGGTVILNDETRVVVTSAGEIFGFSPSGALRFRTDLDLSERTARVSLLPRSDGGITVAAAREVIRVDADGSVQSRTRVPDRIAGPPVDTRFGVVVTAQNGAVYGTDGGYAKKLAELGGDPGEAGASSPDGRTLVAVIDSQRLVELDLSCGALQTRLTVGDQSLHGPIVLGKAGARLLITFAGGLLDIEGSSVHRTALEGRTESLLTDAGKVDFASLEDSPPPVTDEQGRVGFARVGGRVGVVSPEGSVQMVSPIPCASPAALSPAGPRRLVLACRDGVVVMLGDAPP